MILDDKVLDGNFSKCTVDMNIIQNQDSRFRFDSMKAVCNSDVEHTMIKYENHYSTEQKRASGRKAWQWTIYYSKLWYRKKPHANYITITLSYFDSDCWIEFTTPIRQEIDERIYLMVDLTPNHEWMNDTSSSNL